MAAKSVPLQTLKINPAFEGQMSRPLQGKAGNVIAPEIWERSESGVDASSGPHRPATADACLTVLWPQIVLKQTWHRPWRTGWGFWRGRKCEDRGFWRSRSRALVIRVGVGKRRHLQANQKKTRLAHCRCDANEKEIQRGKCTGRPGSACGGCAQRSMPAIEA